jgi:hypothetical protein
MPLVKDIQVDLGGRSLHVVAAGHGSPAVILEAGLDVLRSIGRQCND